MEGPISFWGYKEQESNLILPEHDDDDDDDHTMTVDGNHVYPMSTLSDKFPTVVNVENRTLQTQQSVHY